MLCTVPATRHRLLALLTVAAFTVPAVAPLVARAAAKTLEIYFIDVEGGQATLIVTPSGESLLNDTGFPGDGTFASRSADPTEARDPQRILAAAHDAGLNRIDYLMITHFHGDHVGGVVELSQLLPIVTFVDHSAPPPDAEKGVPGTQALFDAYVRLREHSNHLQPTPGDRLPLKGVRVDVVSSGGATLRSPLRGAGAANPSCTGNGLPAQEPVENPRSTGVKLTFGKFRILDVGDLSGPPLFALTCPRNLIGEAEVYLIAHHGGVDAADPAMFNALKPLVAIMNNGPSKGGSAETFATLRQLIHVDTWQLHRALTPGAVNFADDRTANLNDNTNAWIKVSASADGSFTVTNGRNGATKAYRR